MPEITFQNFDPHTNARTRVVVQYEYTPGVDYWRKIEAQCPAWQPQVLADSNSTRRGGAGRAVTWDYEDAKTRSVMINVDGRDVEWVMPFQQYIPAIDPAGNIVPLCVATCRLPEDDNTGFGDKIIAAKKRAGWFMARREDEFQGLQDQEYAAFLCALSKQRKAVHHERQKLEEAKYISEAEKRAQAQNASMTQAIAESAAANRDSMIDVAKMVGVEVAKALAAQNKQPQK